MVHGIGLKLYQCRSQLEGPMTGLTGRCQLISVMKANIPTGGACGGGCRSTTKPHRALQQSRSSALVHALFFEHSKLSSHPFRAVKRLRYLHGRLLSLASTASVRSLHPTFACQLLDHDCNSHSSNLPVEG